jgi:uncharacterized protein YbbC (DUF1343 family)/CubicO group peptidase (beta-lactamase class C family)
VLSRTLPGLDAAIDSAMQAGLSGGVFPGGVVLIRHRGAIVLHQAYGHSMTHTSAGVRAATPIPATTDTLYDLASLTKLFTATCVMRLVEGARLALDEPVARYLPEFAANGKRAITLRQLLTHTAGLPARINLWETDATPEARLGRALAVTPTAPPGTRFVYSDMGPIVFGHVVERTVDTPLDVAIADLVTGPLRLSETRFRPSPNLRPRIAPTEDQSRLGRGLLWGDVHDENAWALDGVAGHAGLFGTAADVGVFGQLFLDGGATEGVRLLGQEMVAEMVRSQIQPLEWRGLGWELNADYLMGRLASPETFGHTGFTGTSLVIDPHHALVVVLLTNRVHPTVDGPRPNAVRAAVSNAALDAAKAASVVVATPATASASSSSGVLTGLEVLLRDGSRVLSGRRVGLVTNHTGRDRHGTSTIDLLHSQGDWQVVALFSPEHGIRGEDEAGVLVGSSADARTGLPIYSLYGDTRRPTEAMLRGLDALVYDIQDVGARVYTYPATLLEVLRAAAARSLPVVVLDRPNPIGGALVEGNVLDYPRFASFVGAAPIAMRYGLTIGELAQFFTAELGVSANVAVVPLEGWRRDMWYDQTALPWVNPSPNLRSLSAATVYPGTVLFEGTNLSEGRGTDAPFQWIGAPWLDASILVERLSQAGVSGVSFAAETRTPTASKHTGQACRGVRAEITDREQVRPMELGVMMLTIIGALHPDQLRLEVATFDGLAGTDRLRLALQRGQPVPEIVAAWEPDRQRFLELRQKYLLY